MDTDFNHTILAKLKMAWIDHPKPAGIGAYLQQLREFQNYHLPDRQRCLFVSRKADFQAAVLLETGKAGWRMTYGTANRFHPPICATDESVAMNLMTQYNEKPATLAITGERRLMRDMFEKIHLHHNLIESLWKEQAAIAIWVPETYDPFNL